MESLKTDIVIVGAGLVGLSASIALELAGYSIVIIDAKNPQDSIIDSVLWDNRIYAISPKNAAWLSDLGVWQLLNPARIGDMQGMEIWGDIILEPLTLFAEDVNAACLGFIVEGKALLQAMLERIKTLAIKTLFEKTSTRLDKASTASLNTIIYFNSGQSVQCSVLLAADGAHSWIRQQLNMPIQQKPYHQMAIVANFEVEKSHANLARQWFAHDAENQNSILAWLPLTQNLVSIVWSVSNEYGQYLLTLADDAFTQAVASVGMNCLGKMQLITARASFSLVMQKTETLVKNGVVLIGDAARQIHPMAGQGMNLGFRDVVDFVEALKGKRPFQQINDHSLLRGYERSRKADTANLVLLTDGLFGLFASQSNLIKNVRNFGLGATNYGAVKKLLVSKAVSL